MHKSTLLALSVAAGALPLAFSAAYLASVVSHTAAQAMPALRGTPLPVSVREAAVVDASDAFLATLSPPQRAAAQIGLTPQNAGRWSNFPAAVVPRNGVYFRDMTPAQAAAALKVARLALSPEGFARMQEIRATDDAFGRSDEARHGPGGRGPGGPGGPPPGGFGGPGHLPGGPRDPGPGGLFGHGNYIIAFLGQPSRTAPWLLQLGGHHLAFNIYYQGGGGAATPYFVGAQPNIWKDTSGKTHAPLAPMHDAMYGLLHSLTPAQLTQARLPESFDDVYVGPGRDGQFPSRREGVPVAELSVASKTWVRQAIAAWTGDTAQAASYRKIYGGGLAQTKVAYSGATGLDAQGDYVRIDGPRVCIEFCCQGSDHYHTIWRDRSTDYGAEFRF